MQASISCTMVLSATALLPNQKYPIFAFYSVAPSSISRETLPVQLSKKSPRYPIPVFLLAQLAVHKEFQGNGLVKGGELFITQPRASMVINLSAIQHLLKIQLRLLDTIKILKNNLIVIFH
jgi:hypothetical protein